MGERHAMPSGNWIELDDWHGLRRGAKKRVLGNVKDHERIISAAYDVMDGLAALLITNWSYPLPLPNASAESLDLLPIEDDDALAKALEPAQRALFPNAAPDEKQVADHASPTGGGDG